jgi:hypothetical protein
MLFGIFTIDYGFKVFYSGVTAGKPIFGYDDITGIGMFYSPGQWEIPKKRNGEPMYRRDDEG